MADVIDYKILGDDFQAVEIELDPGEGVRAEVGAMLLMEEGIQMDTTTGGGMFSGFKRLISGESFFITTFLNQGNYKRKVMFSAPYPGRIMPIDLTKFGGVFYCQKDAYLCSANGIDISVEFTKRFGAGLFGGEGLFLTTLTGPGTVYLQSLPFSRIADRINKAARGNHGEVKRGGGLLSTILSGD